MKVSSQYFFCKNNAVHEIISAAWMALHPLFDIRYAMAKSGKYFCAGTELDNRGKEEMKDLWAQSSCIT